MPYNDFVTWQLAGDLMSEASYEQKLATGFNRNHKITQEVGVVDEEYRVEYVLDRVRTLSTAFLGLTVECAQCHDHKFDPISQKEFYSLFSFFNSVPEKGRVEYNVEVAEPSLPLPDSTVAKYRTFVADLVARQVQKVADYQEEAWSKGIELKNFEPNGENTISELPAGLVSYFSLDYVEDEKVNEDFRGHRPARVINDLVPVRGRSGGGLAFSGRNHLDLGPSSELNFRRPFSWSFWIYSVDSGVRGPLMVPSAKGRELPVFDFSITNDKTFRFALYGKDREDRISFSTREEIPGDRWVPVVFTYDGSGKAAGFKIYMEGRLLENIVDRDAYQGGMGKHNHLLIGRRAAQNKQHGLLAGYLDELMFFNRALSAEDISELEKYDPLAPILAKKERREDETKRLWSHQMHRIDKLYQEVTSLLEEYKIREMRMDDVILKPTMVMADLDSLRPTYVLERGQYHSPTEQVYPGTPDHILPFPEDLPKNRLGLAQWLFKKEHPLTARVAVNRYWQMLFGKGLVSTPEDFGSQGNLPSHPQLLDWLALDFRDSGWDIKHLLKTMVMSATYRQTVKASPEMLEKDPDNLLLARGPQTRLHAELVRDHALAISGLLSNRVGGPSVKPYQPAGLWLEMATGNQPLRKYIQDHNQDLYRRSMYTFWKRTVPPPSMMTFDASTREQCSVRRQSTNTPMQALVLLNDPQFTEASRLIAERMLQEGGTEDRERIGFAFRLATSRAPTTAELDLLQNLLRDKKSVFGDNPQKADELLSVGEHPRNPNLDSIELAAYTLVANAILNLTETIRKG